MMLDEECALPKGSDEDYVEKLHTAFDKNELYSKPKRGGKRSESKEDLGKEFDRLQFIMTHYAGEVRYTALNWLDKNRGFVNPEITVCMCSSKSELLVELFQSKEEAAASPDKSKGLRTKGGRGGGAVKKPTVGSKFRASLRSLSTTLLQTSARYIRCVKPNAAKKAGHFDGQFCSRQLAYTGVSAVVTIQRSGYPVTLLMTDFVKRFRCTCFDNPKLIARSLEAKVVCQNVLSHLEKGAGVHSTLLLLLPHALLDSSTHPPHNHPPRPRVCLDLELSAGAPLRTHARAHTIARARASTHTNRIPSLHTTFCRAQVPIGSVRSWCSWARRRSS